MGGKTIIEDKKKKKEEERLAREKAKQEEKERKEVEHHAKLKAKQREKLVKKLGVQKPGKYIIEVESLDTELISKLGKRMGNIRDLHIDVTGGSWEGALYGIHLDESVPILLKLSDLPEVSQAKLDHNTIKVSVKYN